MSAKGTNIAQEFHVVNILPPKDVSGGVSSDVFSMKDAGHATIIIQAGSTNADAGNVTLEECDNFIPTTHNEMTFNFWMEDTASGDVVEKQTAAALIDVSGNDNIVYVIEVDASEMTAAYPNLRISWSACGGATYGSAVAILSGFRYGKEASATELA